MYSKVNYPVLPLLVARVYEPQNTQICEFVGELVMDFNLSVCVLTTHVHGSAKPHGQIRFLRKTIVLLRTKHIFWH